MSDGITIQCSRCLREEPSHVLDSGWLALPDGWTRFVLHGEETIICGGCITPTANEVNGLLDRLWDAAG